MSILNAFQPMIITAPLAVAVTAQTIAPAYDAKQLSAYRMVNDGAQVSYWRFVTPAAPAGTITVNNGIKMLAGTVEVFTGPINASVDVIGPATGSIFSVYVGEGL